MGAEVAALLAYGVAQFRRPSARGLGLAALVLGVVGVAAYVLLYAQTGVLGTGSVQRIVQGAGDAWLLVVALFCLKGRR